MKLKSWTETIRVFAQVVLGHFWRTIYIVMNGPGGPFMLVINGPHPTVGRTIYVYAKWSGQTNYDDISGPLDHLCCHK